MTRDATSPIRVVRLVRTRRGVVFSNESRSAYERFYCAAVARTIARYCCPSEPGNETKEKKYPFAFPDRRVECVRVVMTALA